MSVEMLHRDSIEIFNALSEIPFCYPDRNQALRRITELGKEALGSDACTLSFVNLEKRVITVEACSGFDEQFEQHISNRIIDMGSLEEGDMVDYALIARGELVEQYELQHRAQGVANPKTAKKYSLHSVLAHPMWSNGSLIGYFGHFSSKPDSFTDGEKRLLKTFAHHALAIIERFEHYRTLDRSASLMHQLSQDVLLMTTDDVLRQISKYAGQLLNVPICLVWRLDEPQNKLRIVATEGPVDDCFKQQELSLNDPGIAQHVARKRPSYLTNVSAGHPRYQDSAKAAAQGWVSLLSAPMHVGEQIIGMIDVYTTRQRKFREWERELFGAFANQAAMSIQRADLVKNSAALNVLLQKQQQQQQQALLPKIQVAIDRVDSESRERVSVESELEETLRLIAEQCKIHTRAQTCFLRLKVMETNQLELKVCYHEEPLAKKLPLGHRIEIGQGVSGFVAKTGTPFIYPDTSSDEHAVKVTPELDLASILCVPIKTGNVVIGTISVGSDQVRAFDQNHQHLLDSVTDKISAAIMRAKLVRTVLDLARATNNSATLKILLDQIAGFACELMYQPVCLIWLLDKDSQGFVVKGKRIPKDQNVDINSLFISTAGEEVQRFLQTGKSLYLKDTKKASKHPYVEALQHLDWQSMVAMPLAFNDQVTGIIEVYSYEKENFTVWHQRLFETLAVQASMAIENLTSRQRSETQNRVMQEMAVIREEEKLLNTLLKRSLEVVGSSRGWVSQLNPQTGELKIVASEGDPLNTRSLKIGTGITGRALEDEKPLRINDVRIEKTYEKFWEDTLSELAVPIVIKNAKVIKGKTIDIASKPIGVLNIESPTLAAFSKADEDSLWSLASYAALCIEELESNRKLTDLTQMETALVGKRDWDDIIEQLLNGITLTLGYEFVNVSLVAPEVNRIKSKYVTGITRDKDKFITLADYSLDSDHIQAVVVRSRDVQVPQQEDELLRKFSLPNMIRVLIPMMVSPDEPAMGTVEAGYVMGCRKHIYEQDVQILKNLVEYTVRALHQRNRGMLKRIKHEFGLAITGIRSNASFLQKRYPELPEQLIDLKFEDILTDCEILKRQVNELEHILGVSFTASKRKKTAVFRDIVIKTIKQLRPIVVSLGLDPDKVEYSDWDVHRIRVYVDRGRLSQVVFNLLSNSIKYSEKDRSLFTIRISIVETRDRYIIVFKDWGIGIKKGLEEKVFEDGYRSPEAIHRRVAGSGLGLTIARAAIREMGGDLVLAGNYKPTTFHLILPKSLKEQPHGKSQDTHH